jgi:hypothetical protein
VLAALSLAALTLAMFGEVLFGSQDMVLSDPSRGDLARQYAQWRQFAFSELRHGNLPLWNPHLFSGAPFFGLQSGLLYPLNVLFLVLPLAKAINWSIALHVFLAGVFTYGWAARRGLHPLACFLSAALFMFCGPHFLHIYAGHLPHLCAMVWPPLLLLAIDGMFEQPRLKWILLGIFAVAMQVLGGHPQYVLYTAVAATLYCVLLAGSLAFGLRQPAGALDFAYVYPTRLKAISCTQFILGAAAIGLGGIALSAAQVLTGLHDLGQTWRGAGVSQAWAATFSFPPENFLTLLAPSFFGTTGEAAYWGRWEFWEMTAFIGVTGLVLALIGVTWGERRTRRFAGVMVLLLLLLALGGYSPLFPFLYRWVPGFSSLRGNSKFILLAALFLTLLAGIGLDALLRGLRVPGRFNAALLAAALLVITPLAVVLRSPGMSAPLDSGWHRAVLASLRSRLQNPSPKADVDPLYLFQTAHQASNSLLVAAATLALVALLLILLRSYRPMAGALLGLGLFEVFLFAYSFRPTFDLSQASDPELRTFLKRQPGDYRIFNSFAPNAAMTLPAQDVWGYDPAIPARYNQLLAYARCADPANWTRLEPSAAPALFGMLRLRFLFGRRHGQFAWMENPDPLPHLLLLQRYRVITAPEQLLTALTNATFNPREEVLLESVPEPPPASSNSPAGRAVIETSTTDSLTISADLESPALLLITDNYLAGWRARPLPGTVQADYRVMPANYCLQAIPLAAGHHSLRVEYLPRAFVLGERISLVSLVVFAALCVLSLLRARRRG